jgi:hypothetical protein
MGLIALLYLFLIATGVYTVAFAVWAIITRSVADREGLLGSIRMNNCMSLMFGLYGTFVANVAKFQNWPEFGVTCAIGLVYWLVLDAGFLEFHEDEVERSQFIRRVFVAGGRSEK